MRASEAYVVYRPGTDEVRVAHEREGRDIPPGHWWLSVLAGDADNRMPTSAPERDRMVFITFNTLVVRDGVAAGAAHRAFLGIDEYRWSIAPDVEGSEQRPAGA